MPRLVSWNVAGRVAHQAAQARVLAEQEWDLVALQEITFSTLRPWRESLAAHGLREIRTSIDDWIPGEPPPEDRRLGVLVAAREPLMPISSAHIPWPERLLSVRLEETPPFELHNLHSPISPKPDFVKIRTHAALFAHLARPLALPQVVVGDLNTPRRERPDGVTWSFARDSRGKLRLDRGERWERAELALIRGLEDHGFRDAFRALHGYERREISWNYPRRRGGYRLDHVIVSEEFELIGCDYIHAPREAGLSDHSPMWAELKLASAEPVASS